MLVCKDFKNSLLSKEMSKQNKCYLLENNIPCHTKFIQVEKYVKCNKGILIYTIFVEEEWQIRIPLSITKYKNLAFDQQKPRFFCK